MATGGTVPTLAAPAAPAVDAASVGPAVTDYSPTGAAYGAAARAAAGGGSATGIPSTDDGRNENGKRNANADTKARGWTSEIFKIRVDGVALYTQATDMKKLATTLGLAPVKIKKAPKWPYAFFTFNNEDERLHAIKTFDGYTYRSNTLEASKAYARADPFEESQNKRRRVDPELAAAEAAKSVGERLSDKVTPLWKQPYERQLILKKRELVKKLRNTTRELNNLPWAKASLKTNEGLIAPMEPVIKSPVLNEYRNKCEFTIGLGENDAITVGHLLGAYHEGTVTVVEPSECIHLSPIAKALAQILQDFLRQSSLPIHDRQTHAGFWRLMTVRTSLENEAMAIVTVQDTDEEKATVEAELTKLSDYMKEHAAKGKVALSSLFVNNNTSMSGASSDSEPGRLIFGKPFIIEKMGKFSFQVAPEAFFQVNTKGAETLLDVVRTQCDQLNPTTTLLDVCCGTGTIGISLSQSVRRVIGMDICAPSIINAKANMELNGITNCDFRAASAEDAIADVMEMCENDDEKAKGNVVAIVDPPRSGLHKNVIRHLRRSSVIEQLIYISCNIGGAGSNIVDLCRPTSKKHKGTPFELVKCLPVDLFPHTLHCELVLILRRAIPKDT